LIFASYIFRALQGSPPSSKDFSWETGTSMHDQSPKKLSQVALFQYYETKEEVLVFFRKERLLRHQVRQQAKCSDPDWYQLSLAG